MLKYSKTRVVVFRGDLMMNDKQYTVDYTKTNKQTNKKNEQKQQKQQQNSLL